MYTLLSGASGFIGSGLLRKLLEDDKKVIILGRSASLMSASVKEFEDAKKVIIIQVDFSEESSVQKLWEELGKYEIDTFISAAAVDSTSLVTDVSSSEIRTLFDTNVITPMKIISYLVRQWKKLLIRGRIIQISSITAERGSAGSSIYGATKAAMDSFIVNVAIESAEYGIIANSIVVAATGSRLIGYREKPRIPEQEQLYDMRSIPTGRIVQVESIWNMIKILTQTKDITGQVIHIDGGLSVKYPQYKKEIYNDLL